MKKNNSVLDDVYIVNEINILIENLEKDLNSSRFDRRLLLVMFKIKVKSSSIDNLNVKMKDRSNEIR